MNTAARNKVNHVLFARTFESYHSYDIVSARRLSERTIGYAAHTHLEELLNYARVGEIALAVAMIFYDSGASMRAAAVHDAALQRAKTAGAWYDCSRVFRALVLAVMPLQFSAITLGETQLSSNATSLRDQYHARNNAGKPATPKDVTEIIAELERIQTEYSTILPADRASFGPPPLPPTITPP